MFEQVASGDEGLAAYVADLDPAVIDGWDAKKLVLHHVRMEKLHSAAKTVMLQRGADADLGAPGRPFDGPLVGARPASA